MAENKLNRCECGSQVDVWQDDDGYYVVGCGNWGCPNCAHKSMDIYKSEEYAIKAWNRRVEGAENKMEQVAAMFGKKLGEEFDVRFNGKLKCLKFDEQRGLLYFDGDEWRKNYAYLDWLVRGKAVIVDE